MSTGALIFAFNNEKIDYVAMAKWSAKNIQRHLGIPTTIITDSNAESNNTRYFRDVGHVTWYNTTRMTAYDITPYEQTLVLDADYIVASDQLKVLLSSDEEFLCHKDAYDVTGLKVLDDDNYFGRNRMPMYWATVMMFRQTEYVKQIFDMMKMIRDNWTHYRNLYGITQSMYRNDFALSIALTALNGGNPKVKSIPWKLASVTARDKLSQIDVDEYRVDYEAGGRNRYVTVAHDLHAMGKQQLGEIIANNS